MDTSFLEIVRAFPLRFIGQVILPVTLGALTAFAGYFGGWTSLKDKYISEKQAQINEEKDAARAAQINTAFNRIDEQEDALTGQKNELKKQQDITENLNIEYEKQKQFNELLNQIQITSLGARNGNRQDFNKFYQLVEGDLLDEELHKYWEKEYNHLRKIWEGELESVSPYRLYSENGRGNIRKWSKEYLYSGISSLWTNRSWAYNNKDYVAYFKEIEMLKSKYFVETLYKVATEGKNISHSILAAKTLCAITDYEPYPSHQFANSYKQLLGDIPRFTKLSQWWKESGVNNILYSCPFDKIVETDRNYYSYDRSHDGKDNERLDFLNETLDNFPNLSRTRAEFAYLKLGGPDTYEEVTKLAEESISGTDMEPLPYLLLALVGLKQNDMTRVEINLKHAQTSMNYENMITCIQINPKLHELFIALKKLNMFK